MRYVKKRQQCQIVFSCKVLRGKINEGGNSMTDADSKDWCSLDLPVGKDGRKVKGGENKKEGERELIS